MYNRRDILKTMASVGILPQCILSTTESRANTSSHYTAFIDVKGGWDPTSFCDPKGNHLSFQNKDCLEATVDEKRCPDSPINYYDAKDILEFGNIKTAPYFGDKNDANFGSNKESFESFFQNHHQDSMVINGINMQTTNHGVGTKVIWSGEFGAKPYPAIAALVGASALNEFTLPYLAFGGYRNGGNIITPGQLASTGLIGLMANPSDNLFSSGALSVIRKHNKNHMEYLRDTNSLSFRKNHIENILSLRFGANAFAKFEKELPTTLGKDEALQAEIAAAAFKSGFSKSVQLHITGFDSHSENDKHQYYSLFKLTKTIDYLIRLAKEKGIYEQLTIVVGSDFGRTPWYNKENGKDHWSTSSMLLIGKGVYKNTVIGASDDNYEYKHINPTTLETQETHDTGKALKISDIHAYLRSLCGIKEEISNLFPLKNIDVTGLRVM